MKLSKEQIRFFDVFGFIKIPGLFKEEIEAITEEFEKVLQAYEALAGQHDGNKRTMVGGVVDASVMLTSLLDDPRTTGICESLLGEDFNYWGSDGNYYTGDTGWHPDGMELKYKLIKIAFYLDRLDATNGALRVIPGSHRIGDQYSQDIMMSVGNSQQSFGLSGSEIPAQILDVIPGDLLIFNHRTFHSSWGGGTKRRMFTMNLCERYKEEDIEMLRQMIIPHIPVHITEYFSKSMMESAGPERMKHLEQFIHLWNWDELTKGKPEAIRLQI